MLAFIERFFDLKSHDTTIRRECIAGLTTFSTMAYIIFVNPSILAQAGMDSGAVLVATCLSAAIATFIMGVYANYPFALAPGMGLNAYFTYSVVQGLGYTWQTALGAVFWSGVLFSLLNLLRIRQLIAEAVPTSLRIAVAGGMGLFLSFIGLTNVGIVVSHPETIVNLGSLATPEALLTGFGVILIVVLMNYGVLGSILIAIVSNWFFSLALGYSAWHGMIGLPPSIMPTFMQMDLIGAWDLGLFTIVFAFLFVDLFDTTGTLLGIAEQGDFLDEQGRLPRTGRAMTADAVGTMMGAAMGTSTVTTYLESAAGVATGGRTGLTACVVALLFLLSLFFEPLVTSIPAFATAPALIVIGALLLKQISRLKWEDPTELIPAYLTLISIPLTFSIATGIGLGCISYPICKLMSGRVREVHWFTWILSALFAFKFTII